MLSITIADLEMCLDNSNLFLRKKEIWFELLAQKREIDKQIAGILYSQY